MKRLVIITAAMAMMVAMFASCDFSNSNNDAANYEQNNGASYILPVEAFLASEPPVDESVYYGNDLPEAPDGMKQLSNSIGVDLRNSAYYWLNQIKNGDYYGEEIVYVVWWLMYGWIDPAIENYQAREYNNCIRRYSAEELNNGSYQNCSYGQTFFDNVTNRIYSSSTLQNQIYNWLLPSAKKTVNALDSNRRRMLVSTINHMVDFTANYNYSAELNFYNICMSNGKEYQFSDGRSANDVVVNPYRKAETWVFRRVRSNQMTAAEIHDWFVKLKRDLGV